MSIQSMNDVSSRQPPGPLEPCRQAEIEAVIDGLDIEPIRRQEGAGLSETQWCQTQVNCRYIHVCTCIPSPYAKFAGLNDTIEECFTVCTGSLCRDDVQEAEAHSGIENDDVFFVQFLTLEAAVAFCLDDDFAPMEIELYKRLRFTTTP